MYHQKVINAQRALLESSLGFELRDYTFAEVEEFMWRLRDTDWSGGLQATLSNQLPDVQKYVTNELLLCKIDFLYWCNRYAKIIDDAGRLRTLHLRKSQELFMSLLAEIEVAFWDQFQNDTRLVEFIAKIRVILAKARQVGGTVIAEALLAHLTLLSENTRSIIASDDIKIGSVALYRKFTTIYDNIPGWMKPEAESRVKATNMHFKGVNSDLIVGGGNQRNSLGQGMTIDAAHLTEMSTWLPEVAEAVDEDLKPAFASSLKHHSLFLIESTGQGGGGNWFHDQYQSAVRGTSQFRALFLGWHSCPDKFALFNDNLVLSEQTLTLAKRLEQTQNLKLTREQLNWYQVTRLEYESAGKLQKFLQEHPSTADEAFQMGLISVFPLEVRTKVRNELRAPLEVFDINWETGKLKRLNLGAWLLDPDPEKANNRFVLWENPRKGFTYVVGVDTSYGVDGGDYSAIEVVRVGNRWEPDEQVGEFRGRVPAAMLDKAAWTIGHIFTDPFSGQPALMAIEVFPGPGLVVQAHLQDRGYPNFYIMRKPNKVGGGMTGEFGWRTTEQSRNHLIEKGVEGIRKGYLKINSEATVDEMGTFVVTLSPSGRRRVEHAPAFHDDCLLALFIAYYVSHEYDTSFIAEDRALNLARLKTPEARQAKNFQQVIATEEDLMRQWEERMDNGGGW